MSESIEIRLKDSLSEVTRKERRSLLGVSALGFVMVKGGLIPEKISALGIDFSPTKQTTLLTILAWIIGYFLCAFMVYGFSDLLSWYSKIKVNPVKPIQPTAYKEASQKYLSSLFAESIANKIRSRIASFLIRQGVNIREADIILVKPISCFRGLFDFALPIFVGSYSILLLTTYEHSK